MKTQSPFIIWTFRRSGGTNLGQALFTSSKYAAVEHEPFNGDRMFGHVIKAWNETGDITKLHTDIDAILEQKPLIKHCLEIMPDELNHALAELCIKHGYKHLFLYREEATSRLLSLNYSMKTNVWGKEHLTTRPFSEDVFFEHIHIEKLLGHEQQCRNKMLNLYNFFIDKKQDIASVSFEMLYQADFIYSSMLVNRLFQYLIGDASAVTANFLDKTLKGGTQGTNQDYLRFPNSEEFVGSANKLKAFRLYKTHKVKSKVDSDYTVKHCELWDTLPAVLHNEYILQGTLLGDDEFNLYTDIGVKLSLITGLSSPRIAEFFPLDEKASYCRFYSEPVKLENNPCIFVSE